MLKRINLKKQILISLTFFILTVLLFSFVQFITLKHPFEWEYVLVRSVIALIVSLYLFYVMKKEFNLAFLIFMVGYVFAFGIYMVNMKSIRTDFVRLMTTASWYLIMSLVIASGLSLEYLLQSRKKNKELKHDLEEQLEHSNTHDQI